MATEDKAAHKATEVKGDVKEALGKATGDRELEAEGQGDQAKGNLKQAGVKVKDAFRKSRAAGPAGLLIQRSQAPLTIRRARPPCRAPARHGRRRGWTRT